MTEQSPILPDTPVVMPSDFVTESEHPVLPMPFRAAIEDAVFVGESLSVTAAYVKTPEPIAIEYVGTTHLARLTFEFENFAVTINPEVRIGKCEGDVLTLEFVDPTGPHLPQLRYIINNFISGDFISLSGMLGYTGPAKPKAPSAAADGGDKFLSFGNLRRMGVIALSVLLILVAAHTIWTRFTTSHEVRPVFITREGNDMFATSAGQISYLDPAAGMGEVLYSISSNSGDVLNFVSPCDCEVSLSDGVFEGATVLPSDPVLTLFGDDVRVRVQTQMSAEGLTKAMSGERVHLDLADGRTVEVQALMTAATTVAAQAGDLYLPVVLQAPDGALGPGDIGMPARVRLSKPLFGGSVNSSEG